MGFCNLHQASYFATLFINVKAKIFVAESSFNFDEHLILEVLVVNGAPGDERCSECFLMPFTSGLVRSCGGHLRTHQRSGLLTWDNVFGCAHVVLLCVLWNEFAGLICRFRQ